VHAAGGLPEVKHRLSYQPAAAAKVAFHVREKRPWSQIARFRRDVGASWNLASRRRLPLHHHRDATARGKPTMSKNGIIAILVLAIIVLVAGFLMRGPSQPAGTASTVSSPPASSPPAVTGPPPPAAAPSK